MSYHIAVSHILSIASCQSMMSWEVIRDLICHLCFVICHLCFKLMACFVVLTCVFVLFPEDCPQYCVSICVCLCVRQCVFTSQCSDKSLGNSKQKADEILSFWALSQDSLSLSTFLISLKLLYPRCLSLTPSCTRLSDLTLIIRSSSINQKQDPNPCDSIS